MVFLSKFPTWLLLGISASGVITGDYFAKLWSTNQRGLFILLSIAGYAVSSLFYIPTLLRGGLVVTSIIWCVLSIIGFLFIGVYMFHESLSGLQWVGVGLGITSLIVLSAAH